MQGTFSVNDGTYGNVAYTLYGEYRLVYTPCQGCGTSVYYSYYLAANPINLDETSPTVMLNSPAGLANTDPYYTTGVQTQQVNGAAPQWITWWASTATAVPPRQ